MPDQKVEAVVCPKCGMRTEMPERHAMKYEKVHELMEEENLSLLSAMKHLQEN